MENNDLNDILEKEELNFDELDFGGQAETENRTFVVANRL